MINKIFLMGNLTKDPEQRESKNGTKICKITIANNPISNKQKTLFIDAISFGKNAENILRFLKKGSPVFIEGRITLNAWVTKNGEKRFKHEIVIEKIQFLSKKSNKEEKKIYSLDEVDEEDIPL